MDDNGAVGGVALNIELTQGLLSCFRQQREMGNEADDPGRGIICFLVIGGAFA
jgi:hypothetical protein